MYTLIFHICMHIHAYIHSYIHTYMATYMWGCFIKLPYRGDFAKPLQASWRLHTYEFFTCLGGCAKTPGHFTNPLYRGALQSPQGLYTHIYTYLYISAFFYRYQRCFTKPLYREGFAKPLGVSWGLHTEGLFTYWGGYAKAPGWFMNPLYRVGFAHAEGDLYIHNTCKFQYTDMGVLCKGHIEKGFTKQLGAFHIHRGLCTHILVFSYRYRRVHHKAPVQRELYTYGGGFAKALGIARIF